MSNADLIRSGNIPSRYPHNYASINLKANDRSENETELNSGRSPTFNSIELEDKQSTVKQSDSMSEGQQAGTSRFKSPVMNSDSTQPFTVLNR